MDIEILKQPQQVAVGNIAFHTIVTSLAHVAEEAGHLSLCGYVCIPGDKYRGWISTSSGAGRRDLL